MAGAYIPQGSYPDILITGPSTTLKVEVVQGTTVPSGINFSLPIMRETWQQDGGKEQMTVTAQGIEGMMGRPYVADAVYAEDLDNNGLIQSYMNTTIAIPPPAGATGPFETTIQVPLGLLGADPQIENLGLTKMIDDAVAALEKTAAG